MAGCITLNKCSWQQKGSTCVLDKSANSLSCYSYHFVKIALHQIHDYDRKSFPKLYTINVSFMSTYNKKRNILTFLLYWFSYVFCCSIWSWSRKAEILSKHHVADTYSLIPGLFRLDLGSVPVNVCTDPLFHRKV